MQKETLEMIDRMIALLRSGKFTYAEIGEQIFGAGVHTRTIEKYTNEVRRTYGGDFKEEILPGSYHVKKVLVGIRQAF